MGLRITLFAIAALALALFAFYEIGIAYPVAWWLYVCTATAFLVALNPLAPSRTQVVRVSSVIVLVGLIAVLYFTAWTSRKPFLRDLARVRQGMTEAEVRRVMGRYMEGTGLPALPFDSSTNQTNQTGSLTDQTGTLTIVGSGSKHSMSKSPSGEMVLHHTLVFRHANDAAFGADWGIVSFSSGKVVNVEFSPD